jgi:hypothetical protein
MRFIHAIIARVQAWLQASQQREVYEFLARSQDVAELEQRLRQVERDPWRQAFLVVR